MKKNNCPEWPGTYLRLTSDDGDFIQRGAEWSLKMKYQRINCPN